LREFIYLAVILEAFSRRVIGWALDRTLEDELTLEALRMALERRKPAAGLVHPGSVQVKFTPIRVVCRNTLSEALSRGPSIRVAHTRDMPSRLGDTAHVVLAAIQQHFTDLGNSFKAMLSVQM
jgi:transposase InsO family protein